MYMFRKRLANRGKPSIIRVLISERPNLGMNVSQYFRPAATDVSNITVTDTRALTAQDMRRSPVMNSVTMIAATSRT